MLGITLVLLTVSILILKIILTRIWKWNQTRIIVNQFQGRKCTILGNLECATPSRRSHFERLRSYAKEFLDVGIARAWLAHIPVIIVLSPEEAEVVLSNMKFIRKGVTYNPLIPWLGTGLLTSYGQKWQQRRKILTPAFHFNILQIYLEIFNKGCKALIAEIAATLGEDVDVVPIASKFTLDAICATAMGNEFDASNIGPEYYKAVHDMGEISVNRVAKPWLLFESIYFFTRDRWRQNRLLNYLHHFSTTVIANRKNKLLGWREKSLNLDSKNSVKKKLVMLDILLAAQREDGVIDDDGIREEVDTFIFEGHDTTSLALIYTLMLLANNRIHQDKVFNEIISIFGKGNNEPTYSDIQNLRYMDMCIKESLRLYPSVPLITRRPDEDTKTSSGNTIPKNCTTFINIFQMHRKPEIFPNPEVFDPDRFLPDNIANRHPFAYIPFSAGPRNCIGQKFAMLQLKCALIHVLRNFILEPVDTPDTIAFIIDIVLRPEGPIRVKFLPRETPLID